MGLHPHNRREATDFGLAVARELAARYPVHTAKEIARDLSRQGPECTIRTAENILRGSLSARTITRLTLAYGLGLLIDAGAAVTGTSLREHIISQAEQARRDRAQAEELELELTELAGRLAPTRSVDPGEHRRIS